MAINLDPWGDQVNQQWLTITETFTGLTPGEEFNVVLGETLEIDWYILRQKQTVFDNIS